HVVDASNPDLNIQMDTTYKMLRDLDVLDRKIITVFNKMDQAMTGAITLGVLGHFAAIGIPYLSARIVVEIIKNNSITFLMIIL
ncbi:hypothetical protein PT076_08840, partial [Erysipelothrix rhusiopathiae]|nr:hypothetical protein [Erysipelothrix rhusiopathiae]